MALVAQTVAFVYIYARIPQIAEMTLSFYATVDLLGALRACHGRASHRRTPHGRVPHGVCLIGVYLTRVHLMGFWAGL